MSYTTQQIIEKLRELKTGAGTSLSTAEDLFPLADTVAKTGLSVVESFLRAKSSAYASRLLRANRPDFLIAAGTVLTAEQVVLAKSSGADFVVTPGLNPKIVKLCQDLNFPITPGVNNPMAIETALEMGISAVKFFPAEASGGVKMLKALLGPYAQLQIMPTGGIGLHNIRDYLAIPNIVACGGSWFVEKKLIQSKNWDEIGRLVREVIDIIK